MTALLSVEDIHTYYGESYVLQGLSLEVEKGEALGILGRNGMGKTTLINSIMGFVPPRRGKILFRGEDITNKTSYEISLMGIGLCPQGRRVFPTLTVRENLLVAEHTKTSDRWNTEKVYELFHRLGERADQRAGSLSGGEQQMLAIGRALMAEPSVLLLDEPTLGLAPIMANAVFETISSLVGEGITIVIAEQDIGRTLSAAEHAYVLENGRVTNQGPGHQLLKDDSVRETFLGLGQ